jgi:hypothetical protein
MMSYVRARGIPGFERHGLAAVSPRECARSSWPSGHRCASGGVSADGGTTGTLVLSGSLALIALLATITVIQRVLYVRGQATRPEGEG